MKYAIIAVAVMLSGCVSTGEKRFRDNVSSLIDCEYRFIEHGDGLTCQQIMEFQAGCYSLYQMRGRK